MPYLFFIPLSYFALSDNGVALGLWPFAWGGMPQVVLWLLAMPMVKLLVDVIMFMEQRWLGQKPEMPAAFIAAMNEVLIQQGRLERRLAKAQSRRRHAAAA